MASTVHCRWLSGMPRLTMRAWVFLRQYPRHARSAVVRFLPHRGCGGAVALADRWRREGVRSGGVVAVRDDRPVGESDAFLDHCAAHRGQPALHLAGELAPRAGVLQPRLGKLPQRAALHRFGPYRIGQPAKADLFFQRLQCVVELLQSGIAAVEAQLGTRDWQDVRLPNHK